MSSKGTPGPSAHPGHRGGRTAPRTADDRSSTAPRAADERSSTAPRAADERSSWARTAPTALVLLALTAVLMGGCLARGDSAARHAHHVPASAQAGGPMIAHHVPAPTQAGDPPIAHHVPAPTQAGDPPIAHHVTSGSVNPTDVAWLQLMIPMDERVLPLLDLGASRGHAPAVAQLAGRLRAAHVAELARLRAALHSTALHATGVPATGPPADNPHAGHDMPGMITAAELARLRTAEGPAFDTLFTGHLRAHLRQSRSVTRSEQVSGADPGIKALAAAIERIRTTQLSALGAVERSPS
ncbi:DUF305 domain-containing protein [Nonomuraea sp. LP-02]|uniref:DUF305 domain-containing protein n=1 Tax=Nonomuraea sp. LP-02 TaxID=3097960 RepID=UPI002E370CA2|nr:DUF305 domain-containing protein [Nonomuraea sp. LP-02]MED7930526.1 DUF305 domain-containing protein [Nonomuraea sp. LP-02]